MKHMYDITLFDEGGAAAGAGGGSAAGSAGSEPGAAAGAAAGAAGQNVGSTGGSYSYQQLEEFATARAERAERAALASFFKQQGMTEDQVTEAVKAYKAAQDAKKPNVDALTRERDEARAELDAIKQEKSLAAKGVKAEDADYVAFKIRAIMAKDDKLTFDKAADQFLKANPRYAGKTYRTKPAEGGGDTKGSGAGSKAGKNAEINAMIRAAVRR